MLTIVIPMAGMGNRFKEAGYTDPKPLIKIMGIPMIRFVVENLRPQIPHKFIFIAQRNVLDHYPLAHLLEEWSYGCCEVMPIDSVSEGAACTVLGAKHLISVSDPLVIANCDQFVDININDYITSFDLSGLDGYVMTMNANHPKWSYVALDHNRYITAVAEKKIISNFATVGIYSYKSGDFFIDAAQKMIRKNLRVNGEFYIAPAYNEMIANGAKIGIWNIGADGEKMNGLGTPEDLDEFLKKPICKYFVEKLQ